METFNGKDVPKQTNWDDCGVFTLQDMQHIIAGRPLKYDCNNQESHAWHLRYQIALELAVGALMPNDMWGAEDTDAAEEPQLVE